ncbi:hypothetical protein KJ819_01470 [Patescibacteria group bacterium]|nr:hypothetical protein [Patescibacteria group bacterium]MBU1501047.1 hypothetical protein [Patescibacteria group bacterium]MBU2081080.1 hypothetical protein [Patescibacteria group bacterium]MBU2124172.1 hypothetical protein [Patescibacteria group bacterium]MBU2195028.1 hypothetical protein [Patescibacteria group bacterium]
MCDFSLEAMRSRPARVGDLLVTASLGEHDTIGLVSPDDPSVAVCMMPGSRLKVTGGISEALREEMHISPNDRATFTQRQDVKPGENYRDGVHFDCHLADVIVLFQDLLAGVELEVLTVPSEAAMAPAERVLEDA